MFGGSTDPFMEFRLQHAQVFSFRVSNEERQPVPRVTATVGEARFFDGKDDGTLEISLPPGDQSFSLRISAPGYLTSLIEVDRRSGNSARATVTRASVMTGVCRRKNP